MDSGREVAITGIGVAPMTSGGRPFHEAAYDAARRALADAGLARGDLDSVVLAGLDLECGRTISNMYVAPAAGGFLKDEIRVADDGLLAGALAWMRVRSGIFDTTMVLGYGLSSEAPMEAVADLVHDPVLHRPFRLGRLLPLAMQAQAYRAVTPEADAAADRIAAENPAAGARNGDTLGLTPPSERGARASPLVAAPLRRSHVSPLCDGAAAVILQAGATARRARRAPVRVLGFGWASESGDLGQRRLERSDATARAAGSAYRASGAGPSDVDLVECHDVTAYHELLALEALGFAGAGGGPDLVLSGAAAPKGRLRVNASGGSLSGEPSVASGSYRLAWAARAVRDGRGADAPRRALVHVSSGPAAQAACVGLVERWSS